MIKITPYELDLTASNVSNRITDLPVAITKSIDGTAVLLLPFGAFYKKDFILKDQTTGTVLTINTDYELAGYLDKLSKEALKDAYQYVYVKNKTVGNSLLVSARAVGGDYSVTSSSIKNALDTLEASRPPADWVETIKNKPIQFPHLPHLEDIEDTYGFEYITSMLNLIAQDISKGDKAMWEDGYNRIGRIKDALEVIENEIEADLAAHIERTDNPHGTTVAQVGGVSVTALDALRQELIDRINYEITDLQVNSTTNQNSLNRITLMFNNHLNNLDERHSITLNDLQGGGVPEQNLMNSTLANYISQLNALYSNKLDKTGHVRLDNGYIFGYSTTNTDCFYNYFRLDGAQWVAGVAFGSKPGYVPAQRFTIEYNIATKVTTWMNNGSLVLQIGNNGDRIAKYSELVNLVNIANSGG